MGYHKDDDDDTGSGCSHGSSSSIRDLISDIADKHCPDSVRQSAYAELNRRGISDDSAKAIANKRHGDFY